MITKENKILLKAKLISLKDKINKLKKEYNELKERITEINKANQNPKIYKNIRKAYKQRQANKLKSENE